MPVEPGANKKPWKMSQLVCKLPTIGFILILCGCMPVIRNGNAIPDNAANQIAKHVECRGDILLIPMILTNEYRTVLLGDPFPIRFPFDTLGNASFMNHEVGIVSATWGLGVARHIPAFLLFSSDGAVYDLDVKDMPDDPASDIVFYRSVLSPAWSKELYDIDAADKLTCFI